LDAGLGVNTAIGNFTHTATDLLFPAGLLRLLDWQRTYNSRSGTVGALGPGWSVSLSARLAVGTSGSVTFFDEDGRVLTFTPAAGGEYTRPQNLDADLRRAADGTFTLTYNSGLVWSFDRADRLTGRSLEGQQVTLDYDGNGLLVRATHSPTGRFLSISYDASQLTRSGPESLTEEIRATYNGDNQLVALSIRVIDERREQEGLSSVRYRWGSVNNVPQIFSQHVEPELDSETRDRPGRLSADFTYGYGRTFASWAHGHAVFEHDAFGSAVRTEDTEAWAQARHYTPFGAPQHTRDEEDTRGEEDARGEEHHEGPPSPELPRFGYRGELALGPVIYLRARIYDAAIGRFTTQDPLSLQAGGASPVHPYTYANNDPLNLTDPLGTLPVTSPHRAGRRVPAGAGCVAGLRHRGHPGPARAAPVAACGSARAIARDTGAPPGGPPVRQLHRHIPDAADQPEFRPAFPDGEATDDRTGNRRRQRVHLRAVRHRLRAHRAGARLPQRQHPDQSRT
jgi:RHS repeat-associated protein